VKQKDIWQNHNIDRDHWRMIASLFFVKIPNPKKNGATPNYFWQAQYIDPFKDVPTES